MKSFTASTQKELVELLRNSQIVSPRTIGSDDEEVEKWCMYRLLSTLCGNNDLQFPIRFDHRDKPDFTCSFPNLEIGIEITMATTELYERACDLRDEYYPDAYIDLSHFKWGAPDKSSKEMIKIFEIETTQNRLTGPCLSGNIIENEWAKGMFTSCLIEKTKKLNKKEFAKFDQNWLLIFDSLTIPGFNYKIAFEKLLPNLEFYWKSQSTGEILFDRLIIESNGNLYFSWVSGVSKLTIVDLWN